MTDDTAGLGELLDEYLEGGAETKVVGDSAFKVANNTDASVGIFPDQGSVQTAGEQIELVDFLDLTPFGDAVGDDIHLGGTKIGVLWFGICRSTPEGIDSVTFRRDGLVDLESYQLLGPRIKISVEIPEHVYEEMPSELE
jgi:hypothetical protein